MHMDLVNKCPKVLTKINENNQNTYQHVFKTLGEQYALKI